MPFDFKHEERIYNLLEEIKNNRYKNLIPIDLLVNKVFSYSTIIIRISRILKYQPCGVYTSVISR